MRKIRLSELSEDARRLLTAAEQSGGLMVQDEHGKTCSLLYAYPEPSEAEQRAAWEGIRQFQRDVQQSFDEQGVTEDDLDQLLQKDA